MAPKSGFQANRMLAPPVAAVNPSSSPTTSTAATDAPRVAPHVTLDTAALAVALAVAQLLVVGRQLQMAPCCLSRHRQPCCRRRS